MLIYNYQKEFLGIDEKDLKMLGFATLAELKAEVNDFADLFVQTPGYIHNFKHVHWIDFISHIDEDEEAKVLIDVNAKTFTAKLTLSKAYLADNPSAPAYIIYLHGLRSLSNDETQNVSVEILERELPEPAHQKPTDDTAALDQETLSTPPANDNTQETELAPQAQEEDTSNLSIDIDESIFQDSDDILKQTPQEQEVIPAQTQTKTPKTVEELANTDFTYDPHIASNELGLPLDLIEEFIQDFILQAKEFRDKIYASLDEDDIDNAKILAHKLKGVAANLRIEDAHKLLSNVNATSDARVIRENIDAFYIIIQRLANNKEEILEISDEKVPQKIDIAELADDDFYQQDLFLKEDEPKEVLAEQNLEILEIEDLKETKPQEEQIAPLSYSKKAVAAEIGLSIEDFNELFADFENESLSILSKMREAIETEDFTTVKNEALKLKGMSDNMRLEAFTNELTKVVYSTDKDEIVKSIDLLKKQLIQLSKVGA